ERFVGRIRDDEIERLRRLRAQPLDRVEYGEIEQGRAHDRVVHSTPTLSQAFVTGKVTFIRGTPSIRRGRGRRRHAIMNASIDYGIVTVWVSGRSRCMCRTTCSSGPSRRRGRG